ncbi:ABC transporter ATP-binding protein [Gammaproteobacteria bacterium]|nr:ABC transporter ATP-binding protein [Gammaproteobacteria bacterium]
MNAPPPAIELVGINKRFGEVHANKNVDLVIQPGTIHGLIGENGAGKSSVMSILYGFYSADSGDILINGQPVSIRSSAEAIAHGIGMVHQHFMLVGNFTVLENVMLGAESDWRVDVARKNARDALTDIADRYGLSVDPDAVVDDLAVGLQQRVEILKALYRNARILILDEPTGVLTPQESDQLFTILGSLRAQGVTIVLITHKLREIMAITDRVSVMRRGEMVAHRDTARTGVEELAELMVGRKVLLRVNKAAATPGDIAVDVKDLSLTDARGVRRLKNVSFSIRTGEIVGICGVSGNGQSPLMEVLAGVRAPSEGEVRYHTRQGVSIHSASQPLDALAVRQCAVGHVPEDRIDQGMVKDFAARESAILGYQDNAEYGPGLLLDPNCIERATISLMDAFDVRPQDPMLRSANFSGGNQQKLILAREIQRNPEVLLVGQPTRGVDIGAIEFIHKRLIEARDGGAAILLISAELDEIMSLSDRILVIFDGAIVGEVIASEADERTLGLMMANAHEDGA